MQSFKRIVTRTTTTTLKQFSTSPITKLGATSLLRFSTATPASTPAPLTTSPTKTSTIQTRNMSSSGMDIASTNIQTAPGVQLDSHQKLVVSSVLDLFAGRATLEKLQLWADDGVFEDPITIAQGRKQYEPQWYGLQSAFSEIERLHHQVTSSGNPITMDLKTRYKVKLVGIEQTIDSKVNIFLDSTGKIAKVEDKWSGKLPDNAFANAFRHLNSVTVPGIIGVPKTAAEDAKRSDPKNNASS